MEADERLVKLVQEAAEDVQKAAGGNTVTLTGSGFQLHGAGTSTVSFGGVPATNVVVSDANTLTCLTPENENSTRITQVTYWSGAPWLALMKPVLIPAAREFLDQDGRMVDLQNTGLRYGPSMLWIDDIDVQAKWYLKLKREWIRSREERRDFVNPIEPATLRWMS